MTEWDLVGRKVADPVQLSQVNPYHAARLPTGQTLLVGQYGQVELNRDGRKKEESLYLQALEGDYLVRSTCVSQEGRLFRFSPFLGIIFEVDPVTAKELSRLQIPERYHRSGRSWVRTCRDGFLVGLKIKDSNLLERTVLQVNASGQLVWRAEVGDAKDCERLRNGNTLVVGTDYDVGSSQERVVELDTKGRLVWEVYAHEKAFCRARAIYPLLLRVFPAG